MTGPNKLAPRPDEPGTKSLARRSTLRPEIRAAVALEEAGELQEAARVFEYAGEHSQAAALRLEHARTVRDPEVRLDVLREGCARNGGDTPEGRALHLALAESLLDQAPHIQDLARRRAVVLEGARALQEGGRWTEAGELFERLGLLRRAAEAYERGGEIARLEVVLELLDRQEQRLAAEREHIGEIDQAWLSGRRHYAHRLLLEHAGTRLPGLVGRLHELERKLPRHDRVELRWSSASGTHQTAIFGTDRLRIGRAPDCELCVSDVQLSRQHVDLFVDAKAEAPRLCAVDPGSRLGTFWNGEAFLAGEPMVLDEPGELALGMSTVLEVHPVKGNGGASIGALVRTPSTNAWILFLPGGGPLWLRPDLQLPARVLFDRGYIVFDFAPGIALTLGDQPLGRGANLEVLVGDRITLTDVPLVLEVVS